MKTMKATKCLTFSSPEHNSLKISVALAVYMPFSCPHSLEQFFGECWQLCELQAASQQLC